MFSYTAVGFFDRTRIARCHTLLAGLNKYLIGLELVVLGSEVECALQLSKCGMSRSGRKYVNNYKQEVS